MDGVTRCLRSEVKWFLVRINSVSFRFVSYRIVSYRIVSYRIVSTREREREDMLDLYLFWSALLLLTLTLLYDDDEAKKAETRTEK
jgi:hypothetical protein